MAIRNIRIMGDEVLGKICKPVKKMTPRTRQLIDDMFDTMYDGCGVGLAANQVGILKRIVVIDTTGEDPYVLINPEILETSGSQTGQEGCLSLPGKAGIVTRPDHVKVKALDENMEEFVLEGDGLLARGRRGGTGVRVIFMGTPDFAVGTLEALVKSEHEVVAVVTQPDKPKGRGKAMQPTPVKEVALRENIPVLQPKKVREPEVVEELSKLNADVIVVVAFGQIIPKTILELTKYGCINVHGSLLPKYRGAAPIQWAVIDGEKESGITTMQMDEGLDTGDMLLKKVIPLEKEETGGSLFDKLSAAGAELLLATLTALEKGTVTPEKQGESPTAYAKMLTKEMGAIDWNKDAVSIERLIRGLNPWPSAYTHVHGKTLKIWRAEVVAGDETKAPGTVLPGGKGELLVQTGKDALKITELQLEGKKRMDTAAFLRGYTIEEGTNLCC